MNKQLLISAIVVSSFATYLTAYNLREEITTDPLQLAIGAGIGEEITAFADDIVGEIGGELGDIGGLEISAIGDDIVGEIGEIGDLTEGAEIIVDLGGEELIGEGIGDLAENGELGGLEISAIGDDIVGEIGEIGGIGDLAEGDLGDLGEIGDLAENAELGEIGELAEGELGDIGGLGDLAEGGDLADLGDLGDLGGLGDLAEGGDLGDLGEGLGDVDLGEIGELLGGLLGGDENNVDIEEFDDAQATIKNFPNPFTDQTNISFKLSNAALTKIIVFNSNGQLIKVLMNENLSSGDYSINYNTQDLAPGVYFYTFKINNQKATVKKLIKQ